MSTLNILGGTGEQICCPKPCPRNAIYQNGICYGRSKIGEDCEINEQCANGQGQGSACVDKKCKCAQGWLARNGFCIRMSFYDLFQKISKFSLGNFFLKTFWRS